MIFTKTNYLFFFSQFCSRQFFVNIFNLLRPDGGDCLITSALVTIHHDIGRTLSEHPKWTTYIQNSQYNQSSPNPEDIRTATLKMVQEVPFKNYSVEVRDREYIFKIEDFRSNFKFLKIILKQLLKMFHTFI